MVDTDSAKLNFEEIQRRIRHMQSELLEAKGRGTYETQMTDVFGAAKELEGLIQDYPALEKMIDELGIEIGPIIVRERKRKGRQELEQITFETIITPFEFAKNVIENFGVVRSRIASFLKKEKEERAPKPEQMEKRAPERMKRGETVFVQTFGVEEVSEELAHPAKVKVFSVVTKSATAQVEAEFKITEAIGDLFEVRRDIADPMQRQRLKPNITFGGELEDLPYPDLMPEPAPMNRLERDVASASADIVQTVTALIGAATNIVNTAVVLWQLRHTQESIDEIERRRLKATKEAEVQVMEFETQKVKLLGLKIFERTKERGVKKVSKST